jgi:hypothetical protein
LHTDGKADFDRTTGTAVDFGNYEDIEFLAVLAKVLPRVILLNGNNGDYRSRVLG